VRPSIIAWLESSGMPGARYWVPNYPVLLYLSFLLGAFWFIRRVHAAGLSATHALWVCVWAFVGAIAGARALDVTLHLPEYLARPLALIHPLQGGMVAYGGMIGGTAAGLSYLLRHRINPLPYLDASTPSLGLGIALTRIGCYLHGCCFGRAAQLPWAVQFPAQSFAYRSQVWAGVITPDAIRSLAVHPVQLYESALGFALLALALSLVRRPTLRPGQPFAWFWLTYAVGRFGLESFRGDAALRGYALNFGTSSQLISLGIAGLAIAFLERTRVRDRSRLVI
jgi:phosphatidylglycerol:prolipoprotein diacylglycerol transferase